MFFNGAAKNIEQSHSNVQSEKSSKVSLRLRNQASIFLVSLIVGNFSNVSDIVFLLSFALTGLMLFV